MTETAIDRAEPDSRSSTRAAYALAGTLLVMAFARAIAALSPTMWAWGLNDQRFLAPWLGWGTWVVGAVALVPAVARALAAAGEAIAQRAGVVRRHPQWAGAIALGLFVALLPDRTWFVGDFILRLGTLRGHLPPATLFPQALPLDLLVHATLPRLLARTLGADVGVVECALSALKAAVLGALAVRLARMLDLRGAVAAGVVACVAMGGYLGMLTGCGQAFGDMSVVVVAVAVFGLQAVTGRGGMAPLAIAVAIGLLLHREALALLLPLIVATWLVARRATPPERRAALAWTALPLAVLAALSPRLIHLLTGFDRAHLAPAGATHSWLAAVPDPLRLLDLVNLVAHLAPVVFAAPLMALALVKRLRGSRAAGFLAALALPWLAALLVVHPDDQGMVRDWGTFAAAGAAFAVTTGWLAAEALRRLPAAAWLGVALALGAAAPVTQQLLVAHSATAGIARVEAYLAGPPLRSVAHRTLALDYLAIRYGALGDANASARADSLAAALTPSPRILYNWALAETDRQHYPAARAILERLLSSGTPTPDALYTYAAVCFLLGDTATAARAAHRTLALAPTAKPARDLIARIETPPALRPH